MAVDVNGLDLSDHLAVSRLKYLRQRSMRNQRWHDARYLKKFIQRGYLRWAAETPLEDLRQDVEHAIAAYAAAAQRKDPATADRWTDVRQAVDRLIAEAELLAGHRIKPRAT